MGTSYSGYHVINGDMLSMLTEAQEKRLYEELAKKYRMQTLYRARRKNFELSAELNWNRSHAPTPAHLLRLKKTILPNRWINFREGWSKACWGFTNADLTPYEIEKELAKLHEVFRDPQYREAIGSLALGDKFKGVEVTS